MVNERALEKVIAETRIKLPGFRFISYFRLWVENITENGEVQKKSCESLSKFGRRMKTM